MNVRVFLRDPYDSRIADPNPLLYENITNVAIEGRTIALFHLIPITCGNDTQHLSDHLVSHKMSKVYSIDIF